MFVVSNFSSSLIGESYININMWMNGYNTFTRHNYEFCFIRIKGTRPLTKSFSVQYNLYRYICLIMLEEKKLMKFDTNEFLWMCINFHL